MPGHATGALIGGNLYAVVGFIGARLPNLRGAILFLEDFRTMGLGRVDRQLTQLIRSGSLDGVKGIDRGWNVLDVMRDWLQQLGVPVHGGLKLGHGGVGADGGPDHAPRASVPPL